MEVLYDRVAGLDIGKASLTVSVRTPGARRGRHQETRTFKTTTGSLLVMRDWLVEQGVTIAAMESTSTYWKPPLYCLEEVMEVWLLNAAHMKAVPGRKTDVRDAEWIAQLLEHGLLTPSFVPPPPIRRLRMMTRYRIQLHGDRTRKIVRLELMLEDASIKLSTVASSLKTVSARAILAAMIDGETDPQVLAEMAKGRMRKKIPDLAQALEGHFDVHHAQLARSILDRIDRVEQAMAELDLAIEAECAPWARQLELLQTIPGVGPKVAQVVIAETGGDMSKFPTAAHLASWAGLAPAIYESAGKTRSGWSSAGKQVAVRDARRGCRVARSDARQELSRGPARPPDPAAWDESGSDRGSPLDPHHGLLHAQARRAVPRPWPGVVGQTERGSPHAPARRSAREARPHRGDRPRGLTALAGTASSGFARRR